ncbi:uncharacterized protein LOC143289720 isoform X2 [Babylonia areolata]|uniref:uncharacterized protein LOC143289720 isoform X2 n=1 Tax=Babylonia areolata TaxID=304850 RepID=UPI003FD4BCE6
MNSQFSAYTDLDSEEDFIEDYDETPGIAKKDWFKPANVSLARLDKVKPVATVYNLGLRDPRDLQTGRGKTTPLPVTNLLSELQTEPPLSTVSYQKAAWGSQTSIPELLKQAAQAGTRPSRPSSAKTGSISKVPQNRKVRPQSAKDPLCPPGKKKNASTFGVKGHKFDPSDRYGIPRAPSAGGCMGWAGPPAGLCDPSMDVTINSVQSANREQQNCQVQPPPPPNTSPEPDPNNMHDHRSQLCSPPPTPVCLSLSLPSADVDVSEDLDTDRLMEAADKFVKTQKKKESHKMKYFKADTPSPRKKGVPTNKSHTSPHQVSPHVVESCESQDNTGADLVENDPTSETPPWDSFDGDKSTGQSHSPCQQQLSSGDGEDFSMDLGIAVNDDGDSEEVNPLPPDNGFDLEYLGPPKKEKKQRSHPIFLMPEKKADFHKESQASPQGGKPPNDQHRGMGKEDTAGRKRDPATGSTCQKSGAVPPNMSRSGVHIREDCNVTVDITPRNMGRKVSTKSASRKHRAAGSHLADPEVNSDLLGKARPADDPPSLEITAVRSCNRAGDSASDMATPTACVVYDDDDDNDRPTDNKKKSRRRRGATMKERDVITMVSNLSLSDDDEDGGEADHPSQETDVHVGGSSGDHSHLEIGRSPSTLSKGERNYYDVARKQTAKEDASGSEEKENVIMVTTKTILFDLDKPTESVVKTILDPPLSKVKDRAGWTSPEKPPVPRPKSAGRPMSGKLSKSNLHSITATNIPPSDHNHNHDNANVTEDGGFSVAVKHRPPPPPPPPPDEDRPLSRMGFVAMETDEALKSDGEERSCGVEEKETKRGERVSQRPPSGRRRPLSAASRTLNRPPSASSRQSAQPKQRPQSASSAISTSPSAADVHRANAAAQALRSQREAAQKTSSGTAPRFAQSGRHYASYTKSGGRKRAQSATLYRTPVLINSNTPDLEVEDTEAMEECRDIQNRLARYGIDVKPQTLERALFPPTGKTLYYQLDAQLPTSYSHGLLSHPRYWLPEEHKKLKLAEKKLAMAELSLWRQKREEERKAKLAAARDKTPKKGKKKGKKKLRRSQSVC